MTGVILICENLIFKYHISVSDMLSDSFPKTWIPDTCALSILLNMVGSVFTWICLARICPFVYWALVIIWTLVD